MVGRCGLTQEQAGWTSWGEFIQRKDGKAQEERLAWERARWMKFIDLQLSPNIKKSQKPSSPQDWIPFAWEVDKGKRKPPKRLHTTQEEREILQGIFDKIK